MKQTLAIALVLASAVLVAQQPPAGAPGQQSQEGRGRGRGVMPRGADPLNMSDHTGFTSIFDGTSLKDWDGDPSFWKVESGAIVGQSTPANPVKQNTFIIWRGGEPKDFTFNSKSFGSPPRQMMKVFTPANPVKQNTFIIWRGGEPKDFELKVEFRLNATNSGIQVRSVQLPAGPDIGKWVMKGYQADIDFDNQFTGQIYEERGRGFLAMRGQAVYVPDGGRPKVVGNLQQSADELKVLIKQNDWNQVHIIARGNTIIQILNGAVTSIVVDDDSKNRALGGLLGFQMHVGPPMKVEFRNIWLKKL